MSTFEDMIRFLETAWPCRNQIIPCLIGPPGIGKTSAIEEFARRLSAKDGKNHRVVKLILSRCVPSETVGMTMPNSEERTMDIFNSRLMLSLRDGDIWLLDEFFESSAFVQSVMLTVLESREMADGTPLPDVFIVAASNPVSTPSSIKLSVRDRFIVRQFTIDQESTVKHIKDKFGIDVSDLQSCIRSEGAAWNVMTPRTMTKLAEWLMSTDNPNEAYRIAEQIGVAFDTVYCDSFLRAWFAAHKKALPTPEEQMREKLVELYEMGVISSYDMAKYENPIDTFKNIDIKGLMDILVALPNWEDVKKALESSSVMTEDKKEVPF